jgi:hypothetical protein
MDTLSTNPVPALKEAEMKQTLFIKLFSIMAVLGLAACQTTAQTSMSNMLNLDTSLNGMTLTKGAADVPALWLFCSSEVSGNVTTAECQVPQRQKLAIGHAFLASEQALRGAEWSDLRWELSIDGKPVNLDEFGSYDYVMPAMAPNPSLVREVFMTFTAWDIVLTNLQPGSHTLLGLVRTETEAYSWVVNLVIEGNMAHSCCAS